ncbi:hypothetical protein [Enterovibrio calviensis]|uniref:hypothetical protein n=1 Tax=Enterovibrio calviensis TaxID=91359 RepID=UPI0004839ED3|nr:hypothetical protein [Enterovibrio calviensis]
MKKFMMTALALMVSSTAMAANDHAVLNVEGEIQINGKTVIDQDGNWAGNNSSSATINVGEYATPKVTQIQLVDATDPENVKDYHLTYVPTSGMMVKEEEFINGESVWSMEWLERTNTSNKIKITNSYDSQNVCIREVLNTYQVSNGYPSVPLGTLAARADVGTQETILDNCFPENVGQKIDFKDTMSMIVAAEITYPFGDQTLECIYASQFLNWVGEYQNRVYCKGVGLVEMGNYKLKDIIQ